MVKQEVDILVVGGGPAGIGAAVSAAEVVKVMLLEKRFSRREYYRFLCETCNHFFMELILNQMAL